MGKTNQKKIKLKIRIQFKRQNNKQNKYNRIKLFRVKIK